MGSKVLAMAVVPLWEPITVKRASLCSQVSLPRDGSVSTQATLCNKHAAERSCVASPFDRIKTEPSCFAWMLFQTQNLH